MGHYAVLSLDRSITTVGEFVYLSDESPCDSIWDERKAFADRLLCLLIRAGLTMAAVRVKACAEVLFFEQRVDQEMGEVHRLSSVPFCRYRHCPVCQWRRSLRAKAMIMEALPGILQQYHTTRFVLLTLTVRNCPVHELRETIRAMNDGWKRLINRRDWPAIGWIRAVEVTVGKDGPMQAHPHFHALLMVPASYFTGRCYVTHAEWVRRWRYVARLEYDPVVDVRVIRPKAGVEDLTPEQLRLEALRGAVAEVAKYATKTEELISAGPEWLRAYVEQVHALKFLTSGGVLRGIFRDDCQADEDLVHVDEDALAEGDVVGQRVYHWRRQIKRYARRSR